MGRGYGGNERSYTSSGPLTLLRKNKSTPSAGIHHLDGCPPLQWPVAFRGKPVHSRSSAPHVPSHPSAARSTPLESRRYPARSERRSGVKRPLPWLEATCDFDTKPSIPQRQTP